MILKTYDMVRITSAHKNAGGFAPETDCAGCENGVVNIEVFGGWEKGIWMGCMKCLEKWGGELVIFAVSPRERGVD